MADDDTERPWTVPEGTRGPVPTAPTGGTATGFSRDTLNPGSEAGAMMEAGAESPGRYQPVRGSVPIAVGGMGAVYVYRDAVLGRTVVRKELLPITFGQGHAFQREARLTAQLEHPNIVPIYELGRTEGGLPYYTMKWVRGRTLEEELGRCTSILDRLRLLGHFVDVCNAVAYAHSRGVIHRDIKPSNVMVGAFGETILLDWGIAKVMADGEVNLDLADGRAAAEHTRPGALKGTPAYMSPEQADGQNETVDGSTDIWSLGVILYQILGNRLPFTEPYPEVLQRICQDPIPSLAELAPEAPPELVAIATRALQKRPSQRYASARELAAEVEAWQNGGTVKAYPYSALDVARRYASRHRSAVWVGALALLALVMLGIWSWANILEREQRAQSNLAEAFAQRAAAALADDDLTAAKDFAIRTLSLEERPDTRGVIVATSHRWTPRLAARLRLDATRGKPRLNNLEFQKGGLSLATDQGLLLWTGGSSSSTVDRDLKVLAIRELADHSTALLTQIKQELRLERLNGGTVNELQALSLSSRAAVIGPQGELLIATPNGLERWEADGTAAWVEPDPDVTSLALSTDGRKLACGHSDGSLSLLDTTSQGPPRDPQTGMPLPPLASSRPGVQALAFSPDGSLLATSGDPAFPDTGIHLWDLQTGREIGTLRGHDRPVFALSFSPDGSLLLSGSQDRTLRYWDVKHQRLLATRGGHSGAVGLVGFSPDGKRATSATRDGEVMVWELPSEGTLVDLNRPTRTPKGAFSLDGRRYISSGVDGVLQLTGLENGATLLHRAGEGSVRIVSLNQSGTLAAWGSPKEELVVHRVDLDEEKVLRGLRPSLLALSPDGERLAVAIRIPGARSGLPERSQVEVWDTRSGRKLWDAEQPIEQAYRITFSGDGSHVSVTTGARVYLWTGEGVPQTPLEQEGLYVADWSPDGHLATSNGSFGLEIFDPLGGSAPVFFQNTHRDVPHQACFLKEGQYLASTARDHTLRFWEVKSGIELARLELRATEIFWLGCAADGTVTGASTNGEVMQWRTDALKTPVEVLRQSLRDAHEQELAPRWTILAP